MKKIVALIITLSMIASLSIGCAHSKTIEGKTYEPYGLFNPSEKCDSIKYKICTGNVIWGCVLFQTIAVPLVIGGFYLWVPVGKK